MLKPETPSETAAVRPAAWAGQDPARADRAELVESAVQVGPGGLAASEAEVAVVGAAVLAGWPARRDRFQWVIHSACR